MSRNVRAVVLLALGLAVCAGAQALICDPVGGDGGITPGPCDTPSGLTEGWTPSQGCIPIDGHCDAPVKLTHEENGSGSLD